jgi:hypothetical protein
MHNSGRVHIRPASPGERSLVEGVLLQMTLQILTHLSPIQLKLKHPSKDRMRHLKLPFVPTQQRCRQQFYLCLEGISIRHTDL